jgi:hypothetical protein
LGAETYKYDGAGNIRSIGDKKFVYDADSRLTSATVPAAGAKPYQGYQYDAYGNLVRLSTGVSSTNYSSVAFDIDPASNRIKPPATYNTAGSLLSHQGNSYTWDDLQSLATINTGNETWTHTYDVAGERVWSWRTAPSRVDTYACPASTTSVRRRQLELCRLLSGRRPAAAQK